MPAKKYFETVQALKRRIERKENELARLSAKLESPTSPDYSGMPKSASANHSQLADGVVKKMAIEEDIKKMQAKLEDLTETMGKCIEGVSNLDRRDILEMRYIEFLPWNVIAYQMGLSVPYVYQLHRKALEEINLEVLIPKIR